MKLNIHPDAVKNFNEQANALLLELTTSPKSTEQKSAATFKPDIFVAAHLTEKDIIGEIRVGMVDGFGNEVAKLFDAGNVLMGLKEDGFQKLMRLSESMQRTKPLSDKVSVRFITDLIFEWVKNKYKNTTDLSMTDFVLRKCEEGLKEIEIWIPIALLLIQSEIKLGKIIFKTISKELIDSWSTAWQANNPEHSDKVKQSFDKKRNKIQGHAASTIKLCAEPARAYEIAQEETERAISLLRVFSSAFIFPRVVSYCAMLGRENIESKLYFTLDEGQLRGMSEGFVSSEFKPWLLDNSFLSKIKPSLDILDEILMCKEMSDFQVTVLDSLSLYSKSALCKSVADKLIYILIALEHILLKNENEPIMQNIGERIAFFISNKREERKQIIDRVKSIYALRSKFIHHGQSIDDMKTMERFMFDAWLFFQSLISNVNRFKTKEQFITKLEEVKLS
ncbi:MAG: Apea protein [Planctomycetota bacterium]|nr:Apea protein [Planctomycetota bacterium]